MNQGSFMNEILIAVIAIFVLQLVLLWGVLRAKTSNSLQEPLNELRRELSGLDGAVRAQLQNQNMQLSEMRQTVTESQKNIGEALDKKLSQVLSESRIDRESMVKAHLEAGIELKNDVNTRLVGLNTSLIEQLASTGNQVRATLNERLGELQADNAKKLEEMRQTVDEKLHATLEQRLGESFKQVSDRLEQVHRGLGEMQTLATGVGDLKRVLTNVKTRGTWAEVQLGNLIEQILTVDQYARNVSTIPGSRDLVEFAIRLPGKGDDQPTWIPIDAKFPTEDYQRLVEAQDNADIEGVESAGKALEARIKNEAKTIREKYISPPHTTDFGILYLPTEGLYAEVIRRQGLVDFIQREHRVTISGPSTFTAILNSLQMGFKTLAIEKRSSEIWGILAQVKTEFGKFGEVIDATKKKLEAASKQFDSVDIRTRAINRSLKGVEALPASPTTLLILDESQEDEDTNN